MKLKNKYSKSNIYIYIYIEIKEKHFSGNQAKFFFDWKVFFVDQLF